MTVTRDPQRARQRILVAATAEFARHGFAGGRVDRIAAAAGLNKRMLYHYFGDKAGLTRAVVDRHLGALAVAAVPEAQAARLLLWALLDPRLAADTAARLRALERRAGAGLFAALLAVLGAHPADGAAKPRLRLRARAGASPHGPS